MLYQCTGHHRNGARCNRRVIMGFEYCFQHLKSERHLTIRNGNIPGAGKGLLHMIPETQMGMRWSSARQTTPNRFERSRICIYRRVVAN